MIEYTVILAFGVMVALGPGDWILDETLAVLKENHRGYTYAMSMSPMPDYDRVDDYRNQLLAQRYRPEAVARLAVGGQALNDDLAPFNGPVQTLMNTLTRAKNAVNNLPGQITNMINNGLAGAIPPATGLGPGNPCSALPCPAFPAPTPPAVAIPTPPP